MSGGWAGLPRLCAPRAAPGPRRLHRAFLHFPVRGCERADIMGAPRGGPPLRDSSSPRRHPEAPPSGSARAAPPAAGAAPRSRAPRPRHVRTRAQRKRGRAQPPAAAAPRTLTHPWPRRRSAHSAGTDGLTASGGRRRRRQGGSGGRESGAAPEPQTVGGRRVGNRGGDQGRSRHRRAPAFPTPQARPRLASPRPSASTPSLGSALSRPPVRLQGALFRRSP